MHIPLPSPQGYNGEHIFLDNKLSVSTEVLGFDMLFPLSNPEQTTDSKLLPVHAVTKL